MLLDSEKAWIIKNVPNGENIVNMTDYEILLELNIFTSFELMDSNETPDIVWAAEEIMDRLEYELTHED